jgi:hypothetical protein
MTRCETSRGVRERHSTGGREVGTRTNLDTDGTARHTGCPRGGCPCPAAGRLLQTYGAPIGGQATMWGRVKEGRTAPQPHQPSAALRAEVLKHGAAFSWSQEACGARRRGEGPRTVPAVALRYWSGDRGALLLFAAQRRSRPPLPERITLSRAVVGILLEERRPSATTARFGGMFLGRPHARLPGALESSSGQPDHLIRLSTVGPYRSTRTWRSAVGPYGPTRDLSEYGGKILRPRLPGSRAPGPTGAPGRPQGSDVGGEGSWAVRPHSPPRGMALPTSPRSATGRSRGELRGGPTATTVTVGRPIPPVRPV